MVRSRLKKRSTVIRNRPRPNPEPKKQWVLPENSLNSSAEVWSEEIRCPTDSTNIESVITNANMRVVSRAVHSSAIGMPSAASSVSSLGLSSTSRSRLGVSSNCRSLTGPYSAHRFRECWLRAVRRPRTAARRRSVGLSLVTSVFKEELHGLKYVHRHPLGE